MLIRCIILATVGWSWAQAPRVSVNPPEQNFGQVAQGSLVKARFTLLNSGKAPLQIQEIKPSCSCSVLSWERRTIAPGDSMSLEVTFNTAGKVGRQRKSFSIVSNAENSPTLFYLVGEVQAGSLYED
ncbi:MAG: DUF1573 domain-containing protein [Bacteroidia bacterium]|nr:DUF1573 domain-containing protein [Bacteroidia bacterium]MCX7652304.1 DUF1573 domain-containing protein [Bacteroidia bacterium]MDW8416566.1 DUF1573 domain-containing protein [Bacteroidia bacterium]